MTKRLKAVIQGIEELKKLKWLFYIFGQKNKYKNILLLLIEYKIKLVDEYQEN